MDKCYQSTAAIRTNSAVASWVNLTRQVERVRRRQVRICRCDRQNNGVVALKQTQVEHQTTKQSRCRAAQAHIRPSGAHLDVRARHVLQLSHNALWLPINRDLRQACRNTAPVSTSESRACPAKRTKHPGHLPGISTRVRLGTLGEKTVSWIGSGATALPLPFKYRAVSASISSRIASVRPNANYSQS